MAAAIFIYNHCTRAWQGGVPRMTLWMVLLLLTLGSRDRSQFVRLVRQMLLCADHLWGAHTVSSVSCFISIVKLARSGITLETGLGLLCGVQGKTHPE